MVSPAKRMNYVSENEFSSSEDDVYQYRKISKPGRKSQMNKWLSKNAIMARENRRKKKLYINNLEREVKQLTTEKENYSKVIENQSLLITDLKKEVKYLKSAIANSSDIGNLIRNIHRSTGMSITTSLDQNLSLKSDYVSKQKQYIARKTPHPWEDKRYPCLPTPESDFLSSRFSDNDLNELGEFNEDELFNNIHIDDVHEVVGSVDDSVFFNEDLGCLNKEVHLKEHNYTTAADEEVGVCLHVSKHRISVEFCSTCSDSAIEAWKD